MQEKIQQFRKAGADEFLVKPFAKADLVNSVKKILSH
jgi:DNA-binding response OmpR family regulator